MIVPLALSDLGSLFDEYHDFTDWDCYDVRGGWAGAKAEFGEMVEYSPQFLEIMLGVLRLGRFAAGQALSLRSWSSLCWSRDTPINVEVPCCKCKTPRTLTPRYLPVLPKELERFHCHVIGISCATPARIVNQGSRRRAPVSIGIYCSDTVEQCQAGSSILWVSGVYSESLSRRSCAT